MSLPLQDPEARESRRRALRLRGDVRFVDAERFQQLLVSREPLKRCDDEKACLRGLLDPRTGIRSVIEEERVFRAPSTLG